MEVIQKLPKKGFKSITIANSAYQKFEGYYRNVRNEMKDLGVHSFSGYISHMLESRLQKEEDDAFVQLLPRLEKRSVDDDRIILYDHLLKQPVEILRNGDNDDQKKKKRGGKRGKNRDDDYLQQQELFCQKCHRKDCLHVGYCLNL